MILMKKMKINKAGLIVLSFALLFAGGYFGWRLNNREKSTANLSTSDSMVNPTQTADEPIEQGTANKQKTEQLLVYLIEEEKLAQDIYTKMYELWGAKVFGNILKSEQTHQSKVFALLNSRGIADPRSTENGVFKNAELQKLYYDLLAQGKQSATDAYKVGVAVEEKDIADITNQLANATDQDVISTLDSLRAGSENHLRAFNRQL
jgi:hypothetical protein